MATSPGLNGLPVGTALAVRAEPFSAALAKRSWVIRQKGERRAHLVLLQSDRGTASWQGTSVALKAPAHLTDRAPFLADPLEDLPHDPSLFSESLIYSARNRMRLFRAQRL